MAPCSFEALFSGPCSYDGRDRSKSVNGSTFIVLRKGHKKPQVAFNWSFTGVNGERKLILLRAGIFTTQQDVSDLTICRFHRSELGTGWRKSPNSCRVLKEIAHHSQDKGNTKYVK